MSKRFLITGIVCCLLLPLGPSVFAAYEDEIRAEVNEVWQASQEVLVSYGIHKKKEKSHFLETDWIEDEVVRRYGLIKFKKQHFLRRYRIRVKLKQEDYFVRVEAALRVEERPFASVRETNWRRAKPDYQEYALEKDTFMKILHHVEDNRTQT